MIVCKLRTLATAVIAASAMALAVGMSPGPKPAGGDQRHVLPGVAKVPLRAADPPVDEEVFGPGGALAADGRIGKVTDVQGTVSLKPVMHRRWTPVTGPVILQPGDWLRTDPRARTRSRCSSFSRRG